MMRNLASLAAGLTFGFGLALSGMTHPEKVLNFLDVTGNWDASLLFVLGGAVGVSLMTFRFILRQKKPLLEARFFITEESRIDKSLMVGATLFGIGWGISGYCPGPVIALIAEPNWELWAFLPAAIAGALAEKFLEQRSRPTQAAPAENPAEGSCG